MKKLLFSFIALFVVVSLMAQVPQAFKYQAVVRDNAGDIIQNTQVNFRITIQESTAFTDIYVETHLVTTNDFGLVTFNVGEGTVESGDFTSINWAADEHFMQVELDITGGSSYELLGTSSILSVPYAFTANNVVNDSVEDADADPLNELQDLSLAGTSLSISDGSTVDLSVVQDGVEDTDADPNNELQNISLSGTDLSITNGSTVDLSSLETQWVDETEGIRYYDGNVGVGFVPLNYNLEVKGDEGMRVAGTYGTGAYGTTTAESAMFFWPAKAAFRAGYTSTGSWSDANVGDYSVAFGNSSIASNVGSFACGYSATASGLGGIAIGQQAEATYNHAVAIGYQAEATGFAAICLGGESNLAEGPYSFVTGTKDTAYGDYSVALTRYAKARGTASVAIGHNSDALGDYSYAMGLNSMAQRIGSYAFGENALADGAYAYAFGQGTYAKAINSFVVGRYNEGIGSSTGWSDTDPLFVIGNGTSDVARNNAVTVLKNGNVGIGISDPDEALEVNGQIKITGGNPLNGKALISDNSGIGSWQDLSLSFDGSNLSMGALSTVDLSSLQDGYEANTDEQTLSFNSGTNNLIISGGNSVDLSALVNDADADNTNEIQDISISGNDLTISNGSTVSLPSIGVSYVNLFEYSLASVTSTMTKMGDVNNFTKVDENSLVEITMTAHLKIGSMTGTAAVFELRVDDTQSSIAPVQTSLKASQIGDDVLVTLTGFFDISAGVHGIDLYCQTWAGTGTGASVNSGNFFGNQIVVKEYYANY